MKITFVVLALVAGCNKASTDAQPSASASVAPPAHRAKVTLDGKDSPTSHAMIQKVETTGSLQLYVGDGSSCEEMKSHLYNRGKFVLVDLGAVTDGVAPVVRVWHGPPDDADPGSAVTIHGNVATASKVDVDMAVTSKAAKLEANGSVSADVCR